MIRVGSLCSGYGGLDLGLQLGLGTKLRLAWHVEYDEGPSKILAHHWPDVPNHGDVKHTDWASIEPVDVLTAGYPCQPFSHAGLRKGADDPRHLYPGVSRAISVLRPSVVLLENVRGHVSLGLDAVLGDLAELGYDATWGVVRASDAGAPHGRARLFIVALDADTSERGWGRAEGEQRGLGIARLFAELAEDTHGPAGRERGLATPGQAQSRRARSDAGGRGGAPVADASGAGLEGCRAERSWGGTSFPADRGPSPADAQGDGRDEGRTEPARLVGGLHASERGCAFAADSHDADRRGGDPERGPLGRDAAPSGSQGGVEWGPYGPAIRQWESVTGRHAPRPTEPGRTGERLSPRFVEWMMGLPAGHVTDVPGLARNAQLKALGNGVVPQQAALAVRTLLPLAVA